MYIRAKEGIRDLFRDEHVNGLYDDAGEDLMAEAKTGDADEIVMAVKAVKDEESYINTCFFCIEFGNGDDSERYFKNTRKNIIDFLGHDKNKKTTTDDPDDNYSCIISTWRKYAFCFCLVRDGRNVYVTAALEYKTNGMKDIIYDNCDALGIRRPALDDVDCTKVSLTGDRMLIIKDELKCTTIDMSVVESGDMFKDDYKGKVLYYTPDKMEGMDYVGYSGDNKFEDYYVQGEVIYGRTNRRIQQGVGSYRIYAITMDSEEKARELYDSIMVSVAPGFETYDKSEGEKNGIRYAKFTNTHEQVVMSFYFYQEGDKVYELFAWESLEDSYEDVITRNIEIMGLP